MEDIIVKIPAGFVFYKCPNCLDTYMRWESHGVFWCGKCQDSRDLAKCWTNNDKTLEMKLRSLNVIAPNEEYLGLPAQIILQEITYNKRKKDWYNTS